MLGPVPRVDRAFHHDDADDRPPDHAQARAVEPAVRLEPRGRNQQRHDHRDRGDQDEESCSDPLPALPRREFARRPHLLRHRQDHVGQQRQHADDVDRVHLCSPWTG